MRNVLDLPTLTAICCFFSMKDYLSLVKFSHTIFALPFALIGYFLGIYMIDGAFDARLFGLVLLCMVFARNAAMAFNRYIDRDIDAKNPRTAIREIPAGIIKASSVLWFVILNCVAFMITTYFINKLCFVLSPVALMIILGYSLTKRFSALCHLILGLGLALAPIGAFLAVTGVFDIIPILLGMGVLFWVAGFDIIYALQDEEFDSSLGLYSTPVWLGKKNALIMSNGIHVITAILFSIAAYLMVSRFPDLSYLTYAGFGVFIILLIYQHTLVKWNDLSKINLAFFTTNGVASVLLGTAVLMDFFIF